MAAKRNQRTRGLVNPPLVMKRGLVTPRTECARTLPSGPRKKDKECIDIRSEGRGECEVFLAILPCSHDVELQSL
jgi:hypothetical protein